MVYRGCLLEGGDPVCRVLQGTACRIRRMVARGEGRRNQKRARVEVIVGGGNSGDQRSPVPCELRTRVVRGRFHPHPEGQEQEEK